MESVSQYASSGFGQLRPELETKWGSFLDDEGFGKIRDPFRRACTGVILEQCERVYKSEGGGDMGVFNFLSQYQPQSGEESLVENAGADRESHEKRQQQLREAAPANKAASYPANPMAGPELPLMAIVRRAAPKLIAYDVVGVQPMTQPVQLIFSLKARKTSQAGDEILFNETDTRFSTDTPAAAGAGFTEEDPLPQADADAYKAYPAISTAALEGLGSPAEGSFSEVAFSIDKFSVTAKGRALKAELTEELLEDLKNGQGLDARAELGNIIVMELLSAINREIFRTILNNARPGAQNGTTTAGEIDLSVDGDARWMAEKFQALLFYIERDANQIFFSTRRGRGNNILCSADVGSAFLAANLIDPQPALQSVDMNGFSEDCFIGTVGRGKHRVYIDPYVSTSNFYCSIYKGASAWDAGLYYCPYVPLQRYEVRGESSFQPKIAYKTRYGLASNPFANASGDGSLTYDSNHYFRKVEVKNL